MEAVKLFTRFMAPNFNIATVGFVLLFSGMMLALAASAYLTGGSTGVPHNLINSVTAVGFVLSVIGLILIIMKAR